MSIFLIILLSILVAILVGTLTWIAISIISGFDAPDWTGLALVIVTIILWIVFIFVGIGINTEDHKAWAAVYEAQKYTIEASIESETLSGLERIELVNKAAELNGELARRKTIIDRWYHVTYDDTMYNGVEMIQIK
jgi:hypothetical protein